MFAVCQMSSCLLSSEKLKHKVFLDKYELGKEIREADCQTLVLSGCVIFQFLSPIYFQADELCFDFLNKQYFPVSNL